MHIPDRDKCNWLRDQIETQVPGKYGASRRAVILDRLMWATVFENFLAQKWTAAKRFGLEGCETLIPGYTHFTDLRKFTSFSVFCALNSILSKWTWQQYFPPGSSPSVLSAPCSYCTEWPLKLEELQVRTWRTYSGGSGCIGFGLLLVNENALGNVWMLLHFTKWALCWKGKGKWLLLWVQETRYSFSRDTFFCLRYEGTHW